MVRNAHKILRGQLVGNNMEYLGTDGSIILAFILNERRESEDWI
jgi:hypothetical protein